MANQTVGEPNVTMNLETARLQGQIDAANRKIAGLSKKAYGDVSSMSKAMNNALGKIGLGISIGGLIGFGKSVLDLGGHIKDLSESSGLSAEALQVIAVSAGHFGVDIDQVGKSAENMAIRLKDAAEKGSDPLNESLRKFHLTAAGLNALKPEERYQVLGQTLRDATDRQAALNLVADLMGAKIGPKLTGTLIEIADGFDKLRKANKDQIIDQKTLDGLDDIGDRLDDLWKKVLKFGGKSILSLVDAAPPGLTPFKDQSEVDKYIQDRIGGGPKSPAFNDKSEPARTQADTLTRVTGAQIELIKKMAAGDLLAKRANPFKDLEDNKEAGGRIDSVLDLFFEDIDRKSKEHTSKVDNGTDFSPTDAYSRIGLVTGQLANPEPKKQTGLLKNIHEELQRLNGTVRARTGATFTN